MKIGYARISTDDQKPELQLDTLKRARCEKVFKDEIGPEVKRKNHVWNPPNYLGF